MGAADKRVGELLDRWSVTVERHATYLDLDEAAYAKVQKWPKHQRPSRWLVELARTRLHELRRQVVERQAAGDQTFGESLELMSFLTTLLGSEHLERFIPQATDPPPEQQERKSGAAATSPMAAQAAPAAAKQQVGVTAKPEAPVRPDDALAKPDKAAATVIDDAVRLLSWGREWPQLAGLIARLADRPPEKDVLTILRAHKAAIESKARRIPD